MKRRKLQFSLGAVFVAFTVLGIVMSFYRHHLFVEERVHFHTVERDTADGKMRLKIQTINAFRMSRVALLAGDEAFLETMATGFQLGQPLEIAYVPAQLALLDKKLSDLQAEHAQEEVVKNYHAEMAVEFEKSRWRPWHRVRELSKPPQSLVLESLVPPVGADKRQDSPAPRNNK